MRATVALCLTLLAGPSLAQNLEGSLQGRLTGGVSGGLAGGLTSGFSGNIGSTVRGRGGFSGYDPDGVGEGLLAGRLERGGLSGDSFAPPVGRAPADFTLFGGRPIVSDQSRFAPADLSVAGTRGLIQAPGDLTRRGGPGSADALGSGSAFGGSGTSLGGGDLLGQ